MPSYEDVPFELKNYAAPKTMVVGVTDRRTGADTLVILTGTVILTGPPGRAATPGSRPPRRPDPPRPRAVRPPADAAGHHRR